MATLANPPTGFDFPLYADFSASSYPSDPLNAFLVQSDGGDSAAAGEDASHHAAMAYNDPNSFQHFFAQQTEQQQQQQQQQQHHHHHHHHQQQQLPVSTGSMPIDIAGAAYQPGMAPSVPNPFGQLPQAVASSSETVGSMRSSSSSMSPSLHGYHQSGQPTGYVGSVSSTDLSSCNTSTFDQDSFNPNDYQSLLAGDKTLGYVGEFADFSSSTQQSHFPVSHSSSLQQDVNVNPSPFKKPHATVNRAPSISNSSANSPSEASPSQVQAYWPESSWGSPAALNRAASSEPFASPALPSASPSAVSSPQASSARVMRRQSWAQSGSSSHSRAYLQQNQMHSPSVPEQDQSGGHLYQPPLQSQFFHQSSGIYVPPLESSYPTLLQPMVPTPPLGPTQTFQPGSPALSQSSSVGPQRQRGSSRTSSPYLQSQGAWAPYPVPSPQRSASVDFEDTRERERSRCPECGKPFRDMKAHMLTHQTERPEKCPIPSCEYHKKGFSRKYDKNRHTLTHYKGTMVCGFCPHSGSAAEKTFNRADVFKRHLTTVHGVEQNPPNSRKKPPAAAHAYGSDAHGKCSICSRVFSTPQDFYDHLEDCVLNVVQKVDPSEAINERLLTSVADDEDVKNSLERSNLPTSLDATTAEFGSGDEDDDDEDEVEEYIQRDPRSGRGNIKSKKDDLSHGQSRTVLSQVGSGAITKPSSGGGSSARGSRGAGMTYSKGGVALLKQGRKRRKNYPVSWGCSPDKMKMKKRVLTCWDGQRRLVKDDMMLGNEFEVRMALPDAGENAWVTDLDVQTLRRADAFHGSTEEERGPWDEYLTNVPDGSLEGLMAS